MPNISNTDDMISVDDVIERIEELIEERESLNEGETLSPDDAEELDQLAGLLDDCKGLGGDVEHEGEWYPSSLIHESYFEQAMDEMIEDCYDMPEDLPSFMIITYDYDALRSDYSSVNFNGETYYCR